MGETETYMNVLLLELLGLETNLELLRGVDDLGESIFLNRGTANLDDPIVVLERPIPVALVVLVHYGSFWVSASRFFYRESQE